jgi:ribonucleoside-triphosphate reductase (formate)
MNVIKRSGKETQFNINKIKVAVEKANKETNELSNEDIAKVVNYVLNECNKYKRALNVEEIQEIVENALMKYNKFYTAKSYIKYRYQKTLNRKQNTTDQQILSTVSLSNEEVKQENANKNPTVLSTQRDYIAGLVSKDLTNRYYLPKDIQEAHNKGLIHFHDADYFIQKMHNCDLINLEDMLQNGTVINGVKIEKPHSFLTACTIMTQIMAIVASSQYGGQTMTLSHIAPFVDVSRQRITKEVEEEFAGIDISEKQIKNVIERRVKYEINKGVKTLQYQILTLNSTNGQTPFISLEMYLDEVDESLRDDLAMIIEEVLKQRIQGVKNEKGVWVTPAFPKLLYVLDEDNIHENSKYYYLTELAAKCTAKRMVPDYISAKVMRELKGYVYPCMGCRSFLTPDHFTDKVGNIAKALNYKSDEKKSFGRFNQGVVTLNLVDVACSAKKSEEKFWQILDERCELCHRALRIRHEHLLGTPSDVAPLLWQFGGLARLEKGETIDKLLYNGYSTISLGYAGLWECVYYMTGKKLTEPTGKEFGLRVMRKLNEYTNEWKKVENIDYSLYGTPLESTTYKFSKCLQERFGVIKGVTDKEYVTNSYHVHVTEDIDAFSKLKLESEFQKLSPGGAISYVEVPNLTGNIPAVLSVVKFIYDNIMYAELNTKSDYCQVCGYDGEIQIIEDENGKHIWHCPQCGNTNHDKMNVARRTCGYIGVNDFNQGRMAEIKERKLHL